MLVVVDALRWAHRDSVVGLREKDTKEEKEKDRYARGEEDVCH